MTYICTNCGGNHTTIIASRPSLDDRYAIGWCGDMLVTGKTVHGCSGFAESRIERQLCREDVWDPATLTQRKQAKKDKQLLKHVTGPAVSVKRNGAILPPAKVTDAERERAHAIQRQQMAQWGEPLDVQETAFDE